MSTPRLSTTTACRTEHLLEADCPECKRSIIVTIDRLKNPGYVNWIVSNLCMQYMKEGIQGVAEEVATLLFNQVENYIQSAAKCGHCPDLDTMKKCKENDCHNLMEQLRCRCGKPEITTRSAAAKRPISAIQLWDLASLYMSDGSRIPKSSSDADSTALLSFLENCLVREGIINGPDVFKTAREARNEIVHSGNMQLDKSKFNEYTGNFLDVLKDEKRREKDKAYRDARKDIETLLKNEINMELVKKKENEVVKQHIKEFDEKLEQLADELDRTNDKKDIKNIQRILTQMEEARTRRERTMEIFNVKSDTDVVSKRKLRKTSEKTVEKLIDMETSNIKVERDELAKDFKRAQEMLEKRDKLIEKIKRTNQQTEKEVEKHFRETEEILKQASKDNETIEKVNLNIKQTKERLSKLEQESKEAETKWKCECGLLNERDSSKCRLCGTEKI